MEVQKHAMATMIEKKSLEMPQAPKHGWFAWLCNLALTSSSDCSCVVSFQICKTQTPININVNIRISPYKRNRKPTSKHIF